MTATPPEGYAPLRTRATGTTAHPVYAMVRKIKPIRTKSAKYLYEFVGETIPTGATVWAPVGAIATRTYTDRPAAGEALRAPRYVIDIVAVDPTAEDGWRLLWTAGYRSKNGRYGKTSMTAMEAALAENPVATSGYALAWGDEHRGTNPDSATCRWCGHIVRAYEGRLFGWGDAEQVEHQPGRCVAVRAQPGETCTLCGVTVDRNNGKRYYRHGERDVYDVRHTPDVDCLTTKPESYEEKEERYAREQAEREAKYAAERAAHQAAVDAAAAARTLRDAERAADTDAALIAEAVEGQRVHALMPPVSQTRTVVTRKPIWHGRGEAVLERVDMELSDGTTGTRWEITRTDHADHVDVAQAATERGARAEYRRAFWSTQPPAGLPEPSTPDPAVGDAAWTGPLVGLTRGSGDLSGEPGGEYTVGRPEYAVWNASYTPDGWNADTVPGWGASADGYRNGGIVVPVDSHRKYHAHDGLSFGVGDDSGWEYWCDARPATEDEAGPLLVERRWRRRATAARNRLAKLLDRDSARPYEAHITGLHPSEAEPFAVRDGHGPRDPRYAVDWWGGLVWKMEYHADDPWNRANHGVYTARAWDLTDERADAVTELMDLFPPSGGRD